MEERDGQVWACRESNVVCMRRVQAAWLEEQDGEVVKTAPNGAPPCI